MKQREQQHRGWLVALAYFSLMGKPLSLRELRRYLWKKELQPAELRKLARPWRQEDDEYALLPASHGVREANEARVANYWQWIKLNAWALRLVPYVNLVMVMNGLAHGEANEDSDIDLFIVTKPGRVWLARGWMLMLLSVLGMRARGAKKAKRFSPEFFVDQNHMNLEGVGSGSKYLNSFWVADFTPILYAHNFPAFWMANEWLVRNLPVAWRSPKNKGLGGEAKGVAIKLVEWVLGGGLGDKMEQIARTRQEGIIRRNLLKLGERPDYLINEHAVKIHFQSNRPRVVDDVVAEFLAQSD